MKIGNYIIDRDTIVLLLCGLLIPVGPLAYAFAGGTSLEKAAGLAAAGLVGAVTVFNLDQWRRNR